MTKPLFSKSLISLTILTFLIQCIVPPVSASEQGNPFNYFKLAPPTPFQTGMAENPRDFKGSLDLNKHFVFAAMSIAEYLLIDRGKIEALPKWVQHNLKDDFREWAEILISSRNIERTDKSIVFSVNFNNRRYRVEVFLRRSEDGISEAFNIQISEIKEAETEKKMRTKLPTDKQIVRVGFSVLSSRDENIIVEVKDAIDAGVDLIHLDYIDGKLTPGLPPFDCSEQIKKIRDMDIALTVHLMVEEPTEASIQKLIDCGLERGRDTISIHYEAFRNLSDLEALAKFIRQKGFFVTLVINPETQIKDLRTPLRELNDYLSSIMLMFIIPGAGSRPFIEGSSDKMQELRGLLEDLGIADKLDIISDGGLNEYSLNKIILSGVDVVITRSWLLQHSKGLVAGVAAIKNLSRHRIELIRLMDLLDNWDLSNYRYVIDAIERFCANDNTFTEREIISMIKRLYGVNEIRINKDRVIDIYYPDKLVRFHSRNIIPIEHLGLKDRTFYDGIVVKIYTGNVTHKGKGEYILGISGSWHDSSAALIKDGKLVAALEEERMTRTKHDDSLFPVNAIIKLLEDNKIGWDDIKHIAFGWNFNLYVDTPHSTNPNEVFFRDMDERYAREKGMPLEQVIRRRSAERNKQRFAVSKVDVFLKEMSKFYGTDYEPRVSFVGHSLSHAASAYYFCGFEGKVLTIALDGYGDFETGSVWLCENGNMKEITRFQLPHSLGWLWCAITEYLGFKPSSEEGQVMGFAPYGEPWDSQEMERVNALREIFKDYMRFDPGKGTLISNPENYYYGEMVKGRVRITKSFQAKLEALGIRPYAKTGKDIDPKKPEDRPYANLAYVLQERTAQIISDMVRYYFRNYPETKGVDKLALAGGIALNIHANGKLITDGLVYGENIFVQPATGDAGTSIGSSLAVAKEIYGQDVRDKMEHANYGPEYSDEEIKKILDSFGLVEGEDYQKVAEQELVSEAVKLLNDACPIAWFQGKSEIGPRALGARSILLNLSDVQANNTANIIKGRQSWRPSASSVLEEHARDYFMGIRKSPFMVIAFPILYGKTRQVLSGRHEFGDRLARPQTVSREAIPLYWALLARLNNISNIPAVVNTSFNKEEPLVEHPEEALNTFYYMDRVQRLFIGNFIVKKTANLKPKIVSLQNEQGLQDMIKRAMHSGDINLWMAVFNMINEGIYPNCHKLEIVMDCGEYGIKKINIPLVKDLFSGPLKEPILNFITSVINNYAAEFGAKKIYIGSTSKKMARVVYQLIKERLASSFPRLKYFSNFGEEVKIVQLSEKDSAMVEKKKNISMPISRLSGDEGRGRYVGVDVGASRIKCVLIENRSVIATGETETTFGGGKALGSKIRKLVSFIAGPAKLDGIGIALPGVVDSVENKLIWLINYEPKWKELFGMADISTEYTDLQNELRLLQNEHNLAEVRLINDGTAFGIGSLNEDKKDDAVVVILGTGIGAARLDNGAVDVSRIEQSGAFVINVGDKAEFDVGCSVKGCFAKIRDENGELIGAGEMAKRMASWFTFMYFLRGDKNFIITGGLAEGEYGRELMEELNQILPVENKYGFKVAFSTVDKTYGGAIGAAQFSMKTSLKSEMDMIHAINLAMMAPKGDGTIAHYIIVEELVPVPLRSRIQGFLSDLYRKYSFLKEREQIRLVKRDNLNSVINEICSEKGKKNVINIALANEEDISRLPKGVKALVFHGTQEEIDFVHLEGIIAALRALQQENMANLIRIFEILTGEKISLDRITEEELLQKISDPEALSKLLIFNLKPITELTGLLEFTNRVLQYVEESA